LKKLFRWLFGIVMTLVLIGVSLIGPIDYTPLTEQTFYRKTVNELNTVRLAHHAAKSHVFSGWTAINITPKEPMSMAGYAPRDHFDKVHDSIYVRILAIDNGSIQCFIISADLLLFPPVLKEKIIAKASGKNQFLYFTATHAHSSLGGWNNSVIGNLILGPYNEQWVDSLANRISLAINEMPRKMKPSSISYFETNADEYVENRIDPEKGKVDGILRGFKIVRDDKSKALLASYSAHPTNISHLSLDLSGDYPNSLVLKAEKRGYNFAMFAAGMVGSHRAKGIGEAEFAFCDTLASRLYHKIEASENSPLTDSLEISTAAFPIEYGPSQLHVLQKYKVRDWAFRSLFAPLKGEINYLKLGNIVMLGTPCDFSGEIFARNELGKLAESKKEKLFITSFNGEYVGYITYDDHYGHSEQEEIMAMNWVGPFYGEYYSQIIKTILSKN
jgi:hypothetical protein